MSIQQRILVILVIAVAIVSVIALPYGYRAVSDVRRLQLVEQCRTLRTAQKWNDLQAVADSWTKWDESNGEAWMYRGQAALGRKQLSDAASSFWRVPDTDAHAVPAMIEISKIAFTELNDPLMGVKACERILKIDSHAAGAQKQLIGFYATTLQREKLLEQIRAAIEAKSEPREAYVDYFLLYTLRSKEAVEVNERWLERNPDQELFLVARVIQMPESNVESKEAPTDVGTEQQSPIVGRSKIELVDELLNRFPHNLELLAYKIEQRIDVGDATSVAGLLAKAPEAARRDCRFWRFQGWLHESNDEFDEALAAYHRALELYPVDWNTMNRLAVVERRKQNVAEVQRLTNLVERGNELRQSLRKLKSVELVTPPILMKMSQLLRESSDRIIGPALDRRLGQASVQ